MSAINLFGTTGKVYWGYRKLRRLDGDEGLYVDWNGARRGTGRGRGHGYAFMLGHGKVLLEGMGHGFGYGFGNIQGRECEFTQSSSGLLEDFKCQS